MKPIIKLNEKIKIFRLDKQNNIVVSETPGKTIPEESDFAVTRIYNSHNQYSITHKPTGMLCIKGTYNSLKELNKHMESDIKQAKQYIEGNKEKIQKAIERFNKYNKDDENTSQTFSDAHKQHESKEYKYYLIEAKKRQLKSSIYVAYDKELKRDLREHNGVITELINGNISCDSAGNPQMYECTIGNGYTETMPDGTKKRYTYSNMYNIVFYSGSKGCIIYRSTEKSIHYYCFKCGDSPEVFGKDFFSAGCRVYEDLDIDEVVMLCNKDWSTFYNVKHNKNRTNYAFLRAMKQRLIKTLLYNKIVFYNKEQNKYMNYNLYEFYVIS